MRCQFHRGKHLFQPPSSNQFFDSSTIIPTIYIDFVQSSNLNTKTLVEIVKAIAELSEKIKKSGGTDC